MKDDVLHKNALYWSVNLFSTDESINWGLYFLRFLLERWPPFTWSSEPREGPATGSAKRVPPCLSYFKALSIGPAPGIEPAISRSLVKHSTDWANPTELSGVERKKNLWLPWPRISLHTDDGARIWPSGADWLIFLQTRKSTWGVRLIVTTKGTLRIFLTLFLFGKFCLSLPRKKIVCKISKNCKGWQAAHLHKRKTLKTFYILLQ